MLKIFSKTKKNYPNESWMGDLPTELKKYSVINLAIPGSHDSMTYGINRSSVPSLDADEEVIKLYRFFPCFVRKWSVTQTADVLEQLKQGIRYFDLRISLKDDTKFFFAHGLYAMEIFEPLKEIRNFLVNHPTEVVILDFQHFYGLKDAHHTQLQYDIQKIFMDILYTPSHGPLAQATLSYSESHKTQVIIIYRRYQHRSKNFWADDDWPTPWPNTVSIKKLKFFLNVTLQNRDQNCGYVSQCILTPNGKYIAERCLSSLKGTAKKVDTKISDWIKNQEPGYFENSKPTVNIFIADFVHIHNGHFCKEVIELNKKLIQSKDSLEGVPDDDEG